MAHSFSQGRIQYVCNGSGHVTGYVESWRISPWQLELIENGSFSVLSQNIIDGPILWVANVAIDSKYRGLSTIMRLKSKMLSSNSDYSLISGEYRVRSRFPVYSKERYGNKT